MSAWKAAHTCSNVRPAKPSAQCSLVQCTYPYLPMPTHAQPSLTVPAPFANAFDHQPILPMSFFLACIPHQCQHAAWGQVTWKLDELLLDRYRQASSPASSQLSHAASSQLSHAAHAMWFRGEQGIVRVTPRPKHACIGSTMAGAYLDRCQALPSWWWHPGGGGGTELPGWLRTEHRVHGSGIRSDAGVMINRIASWHGMGKRRTACCCCCWLKRPCGSGYM